MGKNILTCHATSPLAIIGFLSQDGLNIYTQFSEFDFMGNVNSEICKVIRGSMTKETAGELHRLAYAEVSRLTCQDPNLRFLAYATPALEIFAPEELERLGLTAISLNSMLADYCLNCGVKSVGVLGTEWDMSEDGPLVKMLRGAGIEVFVPNDPRVRSAMSGCTIGTLGALIYYNGAPMPANIFCFQVAQQLLQSSSNTLERIIVCNPELRPSIPRIRSGLRKSQHTLEIIDASFLYWQMLKARMKTLEVSQLFKNPPSY